MASVAITEVACGDRMYFQADAETGEPLCCSYYDPWGGLMPENQISYEKQLLVRRAPPTSSGASDDHR